MSDMTLREFLMGIKKEVEKDPSILDLPIGINDARNGQCELLDSTGHRSTTDDYGPYDLKEGQEYWAFVVG